MQFNCHATGSAAGWLAHVQNFVDLGDFRVGGDLDARAIATLDGNYCDSINCVMTSNRLHLTVTTPRSTKKN